MQLITAQECGIQLLEEQVQYMKDTRIDRANTNVSLFSEEEEKVNLQIAAHIVRDSNGEQGISLDDLDEAITTLNETFEPVNFRFNICNINYIDNDEFANGGVNIAYDSNSAEYQMALPHLNQDAIDIFFIPTLYNSNHSGWSSFSSYRDYFEKDWTVIKNSAAKNGSTFPHEMGHYFSLYHTHEPFQGIELVNRDTGCGPGIGDDLCDTPADPTGLVYNEQGDKYQIGYCTIYQTCEFSDEHTDHPCNLTDPNGDVYRPDTKNVMSYNYPHCRTQFSPQQIDRMRRSYLYDRDYLRDYCEVTCDNMFVAYDWLEGLTCQNSSSTDVTIYYYNEVWNYVDIHSENSRNLYLSNGDLYCTGPSVEACINELGLTEILAECNTGPCINGCADVIACNFEPEATYNDGSCNYDCCNPIYHQYPWLKDKADCKEIIVYNHTIDWKFIEVNYNNNDRILYLSNGDEYCYDEQVDACIESSELSEIWKECSCDFDICEDVNACNYGDEEPCNYGNQNCTNPCDTSTCLLVICEEEAEINICAPVSTQPISLEDFTNVDTESQLTFEVDTLTEVNQYYTSTHYTYTFSDSSGNQQTCVQSTHIANQFLQTPEVTDTIITCQDELFSYIKLGADEYKIYSDDNGTKGEELVTCNTPGLHCSITGLGVNTDIPGTYQFWLTQFFSFPNGEVCESAATPFWVEVYPKPVVELNTLSLTISPGQVIALNDLVTFTEDPNGIWTGENIVYVMTPDGENIPILNPNGVGTYKLYFTASNENCEESYLIIVNVADGAKIDDKANEQTMEAFRIEGNQVFTMYPNPSNEHVHIVLPNGSEEISTIQLVDLTGKIIQQGTIKEDYYVIDVSDITKGMYIVHFQNSLHQSIQKLFVE